VKKSQMFILIALLLTGCAGLTQMQDTIAKFDQGAHSVSAAQMNFFHQVQTAQCNRDFYTAAFDYSAHSRVKEVPKLVAPCDPTELTNDQLKIRQNLMDAITLYADAIQTLANGSDNKNLSDNSKDLAGNIKTLASQQKFASITPGETAALNAALVTITNMVLDHTKYKHIRDAASQIQPQLAIVVAELKSENLFDAQALKSKANLLDNQFGTALAAARDNAAAVSPDKTGVASFLDLVQAHLTYQSIVITPPDVTKMNDALDALVAANQAVARTTNGGAIPEISDLISRAQQAAALYKSEK